jgi:hypothetical protein
MASVTIHIDATRFTPGDTVDGEVEWQFDGTVDWIELRLVWSTSGRAAEMVHTAVAQRLESLPSAGRRRFGLVAPEQPYTFRGRVVSLDWAVEAVASDDTSTRREITISPTKQPIALHAG